jgi:uncharacterized protein
MNKAKAVLLFICMGFLVGNIYAQEIMKKSSASGLVTDSAGFLTAQQEQKLERQLVEFSRQTSTQIAVITVDDLGGYAISDYAFRLGENWGVGQKEKDNGIVVLIKPKTSSSRGRAFIATGYGVEDVVPDAVAKQIVEYEMIPAFKKGNNFAGVQKAVARLMELTKGKYTAQQYSQHVKQQQSDSKGSWLFLIIFLGIIFLSIFGRARRAKHYSAGHGVPFLLALTMLGSGSSMQRGSFGNFSSGGGDFGGFGGFGGGGFGGGGAGGSW